MSHLSLSYTVGYNDPTIMCDHQGGLVGNYQTNYNSEHHMR